MAMIGIRDKPSYHAIKTQTGEVIATASASKVLQLRAKLQKERGEKLEIELIENV